MVNIWASDSTQFSLNDRHANWSAPTCLSLKSENAFSSEYHGPLARDVKLWVAHVPGRPGAFSPPPTSKETANKRSRHASRRVRHALTVMHVGIANSR